MVGLPKWDTDFTLHHTIIQGASGSGKTTLMIQLLQANRPHIAQVILFSEVDSPEYACFSTRLPEYSDDLLDYIMEAQTERVKDNLDNPPLLVLCFDDTTEGYAKSRTFWAWFRKMRHANTIAVFCTQHYTMVPPACRESVAHLFVCSLTTKSNADNLADLMIPKYVANRAEYDKLIDGIFEDHRILYISTTAAKRIGVVHYRPTPVKNPFI